MYEPCMCGADDCPRCFPARAATIGRWTDDECEAITDDDPCAYCGGPVFCEKCLDAECEGA